MIEKNTLIREIVKSNMCYGELRIKKHKDL